MLSDSFPMKLIYDDAAIEAKARFVTKKENEDCGIAANADADDENPSADAAVDDKTVTVIDIVDALRLQEITLDKASFMAYIKGYLKAVKEKLEASGKADRVAVFQKGATALVKELVGNNPRLEGLNPTSALTQLLGSTGMSGIKSSMNATTSQLAVSTSN